MAAAGIGWRTLAAGEPRSGAVEDSPPPSSLTVLLHAGAPWNDPFPFAFCSGVLVAPQHVLTATHCMRLNHEPVDALVAPRSLCHPDDVGGTRVHVSSWHPLSTAPDAAIVVLSAPVGGPTSSVADLTLQPRPLKAWGWGTPVNGVPPCHATQKLIQTAPGDVCSAAGLAVHPDHWCGLPSKRVNTCRGDSGGPVLDDTGRVVGITDGGLSCAGDAPGTYVAVGSGRGAG